MTQLQFDAERNVAKCTMSGLIPDINKQSSKNFTEFSGPFNVESSKKLEKSNQYKQCANAQ
jgi:hypothetical protein